MTKHRHVATNALIGAIAALTVALGACEKPPPGGVDPYFLGDIRIMPVTDPAMPAMDEELRSWATGPWNSGWMEYDGHIQLDIQHDLGRTPNGVQVFISFTPDGLNPALAAGDLAQIRAIDDDHVVVWNNTNGQYFARVVVF